MPSYDLRSLLLFGDILDNSVCIDDTVSSVNWVIYAFPHALDILVIVCVLSSRVSFLDPYTVFVGSISD